MCMRCFYRSSRGWTLKLLQSQPFSDVFSARGVCMWVGGKAFSEPERCYSSEVIIIAHAQPQAFLLSNDLQSSFFFM